MAEMEAKRGTVYVVDDDSDMSQSIAWVLTSAGYAVETFGTADDFLAKDIGDTPSCLLVDLMLPEMNGLSLCREIVSRRKSCAFIVITGHGDVPSAVEAMRLGAADFLEKPFGREQLLDAVGKALHAAEIKQGDRLAEEEALARLSRLTNREREIFDAVAAGLLTKEIAKRMGISTRTVDVHRSRIMEKLELESPTQIAHLIAIIERHRSRVGPTVMS